MVSGPTPRCGRMITSAKPGSNGITLGTFFDHRQRILRTLNYVETHFNESLTVKTLAKVACLSEYHFHRLFSYYLGDTVSGYIRTRRLTNAAEMLNQPKVRVTDIAYAMGYKTPEAFTKAFKRMFGVPPSAFRKRGLDHPLKMAGKSKTALLLRPCQESPGPPRSGRAALRELSILAAQIEIEATASTWLSVFPDFKSETEKDKAAKPVPCVNLGQLNYQIHFPRDHSEFLVFNSGSHAVFLHGGKTIVFRKVEETVPLSNRQPPRHLPRLPIGLRSILCVPHQ